MAARIGGVMRLAFTEMNSFLCNRSSVVVESRRFVRGLRRKPVRVWLPETEPTEPATAAIPKVNKKEAKVTSSFEQRERSDAFKAMADVQPAVKRAAGGTDQVEGLRFERAAAGDKRLGRLVSVARSRTFREHQGKILLEGRRLICDALDAGANPQMVFFSTAERLRELPLDKLRRATLVKVKFEDIKIWSDVQAPQGVIAIFSRPDPSRMNFAYRGQSLPLSLICDNIRDPGNLGTILRCAVAASCHSVLLTKGCVDAWEPKVLRAAMGAHFRLPIYPNLDWKDVRNHLPDSIRVHVADGSCVPAERTEGQAAVSHRPSKAEDYGWVSARRVDETEDYEDSSDSEDEGLSSPVLDTKLYHESWVQGPAALVIGGETHGLSPDAVQLAQRTGGHKLVIPVAPGVDSLNAAVAASILLFEGRKQLIEFLQTSAKKQSIKARRERS